MLSESYSDKRYELVSDAVLVVSVPRAENTFVVKEPDIDRGGAGQSRGYRLQSWSIPSWKGCAWRKHISPVAISTK
jgi:hypothetical protein